VLPAPGAPFWPAPPFEPLLPLDPPPPELPGGGAGHDNGLVSGSGVLVTQAGSGEVVLEIGEVVLGRLAAVASAAALSAPAELTTIAIATAFRLGDIRLLSLQLFRSRRLRTLAGVLPGRPGL
jgi:hypothetical protein